MNINDKISGFRLISSEQVPEISATLNIFEHEKSGAALAFIDREDQNLTFAISFRTPPSDDTGVFHIIEHSVLCGSKKFPVKEPFVELLKGSLNTFLNAMTYEDKTVYPVSSRCERDFYNLMDVYLDAVFHPLMLEDKSIFMQEGHHLEYDEKEDALTYNGVVYNEMQGAYSSPDELSASALSRALFSPSHYSRDSGGSPEAIPSLTYEEFCEAHKKHYHPSNAQIVLDGSVNLEESLALIGSYLSEYERRDEKICLDTPKARIAPLEKVYFEASEGEDRGARLIFASVFGTASDREKTLTASVLQDALAGTNDSPLKRPLLNSGLCEDVNVYSEGDSNNTLILELLGVKESSVPELISLVKRTIEGILDRGIEKSRLRATLGRLKFRLRERDYGAFPVGVALSLSALGMWNRGVSPKEALCFEELLCRLEEYVDTDYYERALLAVTLESAHRATVLMLPSSEPTEMNKKIAERLDMLRLSLTDGQKAKIISEARALKEKQAAPDKPDALEKIPRLAVSDISSEKKTFSTEKYRIDGAQILRHKVKTSGILYTELYFSAKNLTNEELTALSLLSSLFTNLDTESYSTDELQGEIKLSLGSFSPMAIAFTRVSDGGAIPLFLIKTSALCENQEKIIELCREVLLRSNLSSPEKIKEILTQIRSATETSVLSSGDGMAGERIEGALSESGRVNEEILGLPAYRRIKAWEADFAAECDRLIEILKSLVERIFTRENLTLGIAGDVSAEYIERLVKIFPEGEKISRCEMQKGAPEKRREGILLPIKVSHTGMGISSPRAKELLGAFKVAANILSYEYLWGAVRVMGGAYGTGLVCRRHGSVMLYSYRDPSPKNTLRVFCSAGDFLREFADGEPDLTKYIIGAVGEYDILRTPRTAAAQKTADFITGWSEEAEAGLLRDILACTPERLIEVASVLDLLNDEGSFSVVSGKETLSSLEGIEIILP